MRLEYIICNREVASSIAEEKNNFITRCKAMPMSDFIMNGSVLERRVLVKYGYNSRKSYLSYDAVIYVNRRLSIFPIQPNNAILSFAFTGCYMAVFDFRNRRYGAHIALDGNPEVKRYWNLLVRNNLIQNCILFNPTAPFLSINPTCWGLITDSNDCYTILTNETCKREYVPETNSHIYRSTLGNEQISLIRNVTPLTGNRAIIQ